MANSCPEASAQDCRTSTDVGFDGGASVHH